MSLPDSWRSDVEQLIFELFHLVDSGRADETPQFVTDDFTFLLGPHELDRAGYEAAMKNRAAAAHTSRHSVSNIRVVDTGDQTVTLSYITAAHRREPGDEAPHIMVGDCEDEWVHLDDGWKLRRRSMSLAFPPDG